MDFVKRGISKKTKQPKVSHKMGYCTLRSVQPIKCSLCSQKFHELHQPHKYRLDYMVCADCFVLIKS